MASSVIKKPNIIDGIDIYKPDEMQSKPFNEGNAGLVLQIKVHGEIKGYLTIRSKNFANGIALQLYDDSWNIIWAINKVNN